MGLRHAAQAPAALVALLCACGSAQQGNQRRRRGRVPQRMGLGPGRGGCRVGRLLVTSACHRPGVGAVARAGIQGAATWRRPPIAPLTTYKKEKPQRAVSEGGGGPDRKQKGLTRPSKNPRWMGGWVGGQVVSVVVVCKEVSEYAHPNMVFCFVEVPLRCLRLETSTV